MAYFNVKNIKIEAVATAVPTKEVKYTDFIDAFGREHMEKFVKSSGIKAFRQSIPEQTAGDLGFEAANKLLQEQKIDNADLAFVMFATYEPDYKRPGTSFVIHKRLNLSTDTACVDLGLGCAGGVYGIQTASSLLQTSDKEYGLLILGVTNSKNVWENDRVVTPMLGDAASAILLRKTEEPVVRNTLLKADGQGYKYIIIPAGGARYPDAPSDVYMGKDNSERSLYNTYMNGPDVFAFGTGLISDDLKEYMAHENTTCNDYDSVILHQANRYMMKLIGKRIKCDEEKIPISLDRYGNTSGVSIPLTICDHYGNKTGKHKTLVCAFGVGLGWGITTLEINADNVYPIIETDSWFSEGRIEMGEL